MKGKGELEHAYNLADLKRYYDYGIYDFENRIITSVSSKEMRPSSAFPLIAKPHTTN